MKLASRYMRKYKQKKANKLALMGLLILVLAIAIYQPLYLAIFFGFILVIIVLGKIEQSKIEKYFEDLYEDRKSLSICEFSREFDPQVIDTWVIRATYEQLQAAIPTKQKMPIKACDNLFDTLMLDEDDLDLDLVEQIAARTGRSLENYKSNPYYGHVTTARNLVLFFNHQAIANAK